MNIDRIMICIDCVLVKIENEHNNALLNQIQDYFDKALEILNINKEDLQKLRKKLLDFSNVENVYKNINTLNKYIRKYKKFV